MTKNNLPKDNSSNDRFVCLVCGDIARGLNFNVMTCMPCKTFFRKNIFKQSNINCEFKKNCTITKVTRSFCSFCRLKKCLELGMDPKLIRSIPQSNLVTKKISKLSTPLPLNLLQNDRSTLTNNEWTLLSNFLHAFDKQNINVRIKYYLDQMAILPPKLRLRSSDTYNLVGQFFTGIQPLIEHSPDLYSLPSDVRRTLMRHNLHATGALMGIFLCRELDLYNNSCFLNSCNVAYGVDFIIECTRNSLRCDQNGNLIKLMLFIIAFSSNCSHVIYDSQEDFSTMKNSIYLIHVQNVYITMLWKYLVYLYGFKEAVIRYSYIIKNILDIIQMVAFMPKNETHELMIETIRTETERALIIKD